MPQIQIDRSDTSRTLLIEVLQHAHLGIKIKTTTRATVKPNPAERIAFVRRHGPKIAKMFNAMWKDWQGTITGERIRSAMDTGTLDELWIAEINEIVRQVMVAEFEPAMGKMVAAQGNDMIGRIAAAIKAPAFDLSNERVLAFLDQEALYWTVDSTPKMINGLRDAMVKMTDSNYTFAQVKKMIYRLFELTPLHQEAVTKFYDDLIEAGVKPIRADAQTDKYSNRLRALRTETIFRTETSRAFNWSNQEGVRQTMETGLIEQAMKERHVVMDGREQHGDMHMERVPIDEPYSNGEMYPGEVDINCRCTEIYIFEERRAA